ncbi:MAG: PPC domain-containing protein, partial [Candidatus Omnitrophica bacterium]|nr:PPC domain-containing protein [Candidatus Omnitrophota bacterium]
MKFRILSLLPLIVMALAPASWGRYTPLFHLDPPGGQRGTVVGVTLSGERLSDFAEVMFYDDDIEVAGHEVLDDEHVLCQFRIDPDALLGTHPLRVRTKTGISHLVLFSVGNLEEVFESEPNDKKETAQPIRKRITLNGRAGFEDVDYYAIDLTEGERLSVELEGIRLGEDHWDRNFCLFDPELRLYGPDGDLELFADDTPPLTQDPGFVYHAKTEGTYVIAVSDSAFAGFGGDRYRLHVGEFPRPQTFCPLGAKPGETVQVKWLGDPDMGLQTVTVPDDPSLESMSLFAHRGEDLSPTGFPFLIQSYPTHFETEPNNENPSAPPLSIPCAVEGTIDPAGDADVFEFEGKEGDTLIFRVYARNYQLYQTRFGSSLDSRIAVFGPGGEALVW